MKNNQNHHQRQEVQKLIDKSSQQLNALYEYDNESESSKDELYLNLKQLNNNRNGSDSSDGSGYNPVDKSMDDLEDIENAEYDEDSMAILAEITKNLELDNNLYRQPDDQETPLNKCCNAFWNLFKYISIFLSIFWMIFLLVILIQPSMKNIRALIYYIDPIAGKNHPVPHLVNSKASCSTYDMSRFAQSFNVYLIFHFFRWFIYSLIYRNRLILWINSILWELIQFFIASIIVFNLQWIGQCWYNSIIFDILLTNMCGIELGYIIMKKTETVELYNEFNEIFKCKISFYKSFVCIWCTIIIFQLQ
eukprot:128186_1